MNEQTNKKKMFTILGLHWGFLTAIILAGLASYCVYLASKESAEYRMQGVKDHIDTSELNVIDAMKAQYEMLPDEIQSQFVESLDLTKGQIVTQINKKNESSKKEIVQIFQDESEKIKTGLTNISKENKILSDGIKESNMLNQKVAANKPLEDLSDFVLNPYFEIIKKLEEKNREYLVKKSNIKSHPNHPNLRTKYRAEASNVLNELFKLREDYLNDLDKLSLLLQPFEGQELFELGKTHIKWSNEFYKHYNTYSKFEEGSFKGINEWKESYKLFSSEISKMVAKNRK